MKKNLLLKNMDYLKVKRYLYINGVKILIPDSMMKYMTKKTMFVLSLMNIQNILEAEEVSMEQ
jgi:hypothetical protein